MRCAIPAPLFRPNFQYLLNCTLVGTVTAKQLAKFAVTNSNGDVTFVNVQQCMRSGMGENWACVYAHIFTIANYIILTY